METDILRQMQTTRVPVRQVSSDTVARLLEANGWLKSVAGEDDFATAVKAVVAMYATGRGLFITGEAGNGKTQLLKALHRIMGASSYQWYYCKERRDLALLRPQDSDAFKKSVFIDDIGAEEIIKEYGNKVDVIGDFIQLYHYRGKGRFMATTNLTSDKVNETYNGRVFDRLLEMCVILGLRGASKRKCIIF